MNKLTKLTKSQIDLQSEIRDKWIKICLDTSVPMNETDAIKGIKWLYSISNLKEPKVLIFESPMGCQIFLNFAQNSMDDTVGDPVWRYIQNSMDDTVGDPEWNSVRNSVEKKKLRYFSMDFFNSWWYAGYFSYDDYSEKREVFSLESFNTLRNYLESG